MPARSLDGVRLYLITGDRRGRDLERALAAALGALPAGGAAVQVRAKALTTRELLDLTRRVVAAAEPHGAPVLVNDRLDVALAAGADGVHLPEAGLSIADARTAAGDAPILVGRSTHSAADAGRAADDGADLVVVGPIFETPSKAAYGPPLGLSALRDAASTVARAHRDRPRLFALGGITDRDRALACFDHGADGVATIRGVLDAADPARAAAALWGLSAGVPI